MSAFIKRSPRSLGDLDQKRQKVDIRQRSLDLSKRRPNILSDHAIPITANQALAAFLIKLVDGLQNQLCQGIPIRRFNC